MSFLINILFQFHGGKEEKLALEGGEKMNKKIFALTMSILVIGVMATSMLGTVQACGWKRWGKPKTVDVYERTPGVDLPTVQLIEEIPGNLDKVICNGSLWIKSGISRTSIYGSELDDRGPLGFGTEYKKTIISISHIDGEWVNTPLGETTIFGYGYGIAKVTLDIEDGPYGTGSLSGIGRAKWEWDLSDPLNRRYEHWGTISLKHGTGDFAGMQVYIEYYSNPFLGWFHTKTTVVAS
jgi:hypothetical protein